jgi:hypothetical protein
MDHRVAYGSAHALDLSFLPGGQLDIDLAVVRATRQYFGNPGCSHPIFKPNTLDQLLQPLGLDPSPYPSPISLDDLISRMGQSIGELSIVGEKQNPLRVAVKPAHRENAPGEILEKVVNGLSPMRIGGAHQVAGGFIQQHIDPTTLPTHPASVQGDLIFLHVHLQAQLRDSAAINSNPPLQNVPIRLPSGHLRVLG